MKVFPYKEIASFIALAVVFIVASILAQEYKAEISAVVMGGGALGVIGFIFLTALFVIFVIPLDIAVLIPVGAVVFGPVPTALMSIAGWTMGAMAAFGIARYLGAPAVKRLVGLGRVKAIEARIPKRNLFWSVVVLRMLVSVDILSYALGLLSDMPWGSYTLATALGVVPFGFYFAYTGALPLMYRTAAVALAVLLATFVVLRYGLVREP